MPSAPSSLPSQLSTSGWTYEVLQWEPNRATPSPQECVAPFSNASGLVSPLSPPPVWTPFRCLSWHPSDGLVRLRSSGEKRPPPSGLYVFDQAPGRGGLVAGARRPSTTHRDMMSSLSGEPSPSNADGSAVDTQETTNSRNAVSAAAVARMEAMASSPAEEDAEASNDETAHKGRLSGLRRRWTPARTHTSQKQDDGSTTAQHGRPKRRAIHFKLRDLRGVQRYCFSTPTTVELTSSFTEWTDERRVEAVAYRYCLFGPVGLILRLRGGLNVFLVFRNVLEAEEVHAFFQTKSDQQHRPVDDRSGTDTEVGQPPAVTPRGGGAARRVRFLLPKRLSGDHGEKPNTAPHHGPTSPSPAAIANTNISSSSALSAHERGKRNEELSEPSRVEGSSVFDPSSQLTEREQKEHLHMPDDGCIDVRPYANAAARHRAKEPAEATESDQQPPDEAKEEAEVSSAFRRVYLRPSRVTRRYMRGIRSSALVSSTKTSPAASPRSEVSSSEFPFRQEATEGASVLCATSLMTDDADTRPLNVHLTRSRVLWWQRLKYRLSNSAPAFATVDLRRSRVINLSSNGRCLAWHVELPQTHPMPLDKSLVRVMGSFTQGPSRVTSDETVWHGALQVTLSSAAAKEKWLRWFDLMGAQVEWTQSIPVPPLHPTLPTATAPAMTTADSATLSDARQTLAPEAVGERRAAGTTVATGGATQDDDDRNWRRRLSVKEDEEVVAPPAQRSPTSDERLEPPTPKDIPGTALPSSESDTDDAPKPPEAPALLTNAPGAASHSKPQPIHTTTYLRDTSSSSSSSSSIPLPDSSTAPSTTSRVKSRDLNDAGQAPILPLQETSSGPQRGGSVDASPAARVSDRSARKQATVEAQATAAVRGGDTYAAAEAASGPASEAPSETVSVDTPEAETPLLPPSTPPPPASVVIVVNAQLPATFGQWRRDVTTEQRYGGAVVSAVTETNAPPSPLPPAEMPPWRKALIAALHDRGVLQGAALNNSTQRDSCEEEPPASSSSADSSLSSVYCSPDILDCPQEGSPPDTAHPLETEHVRLGQSTVDAAADAIAPTCAAEADPESPDGRPFPAQRSQTRAPSSPPSSSTAASASSPVRVYQPVEPLSSPVESSSQQTPAGLQSFIEDTASQQERAAALVKQLFPTQGVPVRPRDPAASLGALSTPDRARRLQGPDSPSATHEALDSTLSSDLRTPHPSEGDSTPSPLARPPFTSR